MKRYLIILVFWSAVILLCGYTVLKFANIVFFPALGAGVSLLSVIMPELINMGISHRKEANVLEKLSPVPVALILVYLTTYVPHTIPIAVFNSYLIGMTVSYIGEVIQER